MKRIEKITRKAISAGLKTILKDLDKGIEAVKSETHSRGVLRSSVTIGRATDECEKAAQKLRDLVANQHSWAVEHCIAFTTVTKVELLKQASDYFDKFREESTNRLQSLSEVTGIQGAHFDQNIDRLDESIDDAYSASILDLEQQEAVKERKLIRWIGKPLARVFKFFMGS